MNPSHPAPSASSSFAAGSTETSEDFPTGAASSGRILVVDDIPTNVRLLSGILMLEGFDVVGVNSGADALEMLRKAQGDDATPEASIDVVLLDVMMPGMDGFETCAHIRADPTTASLPVVMVTALHEAPDRVRALEAGADDFLTKPIEENEVIARVRSLVRAKRDRDALEKAYLDIKAVEELRHFLTEMLVHDLRTPLTTVIASLNLLETGMVGELDPIQQEVTTMCTRSSQHLLSLVNELLDISRLEGGEMPLDREDIEAKELLQDAITHTTSMSRHEGSAVQIKIAPDTPLAWADKDLLRRILINLIGNALKFARLQSPVIVSIDIQEGATGKEMRWSIRDDGEGVPLADQERIFSKFGQVQGRRTERRTSTGLGLTFCKLAVEAHGGRIGVESTPGQGSTFWFSLPLSAG